MCQRFGSRGPSAPLVGASFGPFGAGLGSGGSGCSPLLLREEMLSGLSALASAEVLIEEQESWCFGPRGAIGFTSQGSQDTLRAAPADGESFL
mmetsp:Transcript_43190/g.123094  ORF Transcript_43190/g.123094 Transcript_43190/m.123094 type:complete len:93 (-) Transcript_43190:15-293(-)